MGVSAVFAVAASFFVAFLSKVVIELILAGMALLTSINTLNNERHKASNAKDANTDKDDVTVMSTFERNVEPLPPPTPTATSAYELTQSSDTTAALVAAFESGVRAEAQLQEKIQTVKPATTTVAALLQADTEAESEADAELPEDKIQAAENAVATVAIRVQAEAQAGAEVENVELETESKTKTEVKAKVEPNPALPEEALSEAHMNLTVCAEENQLSVEVPRREKSYTSLADIFAPAVATVHKPAPKCAPKPAPKTASAPLEKTLFPESASCDEEADRSEGDDESEGTESSDDEMDSTLYAEENQVSVEVLRRENSYTLLADIFAPLFNETDCPNDNESPAIEATAPKTGCNPALPARALSKKSESLDMPLPGSAIKPEKVVDVVCADTVTIAIGDEAEAKLLKAAVTGETDAQLRAHKDGPLIPQSIYPIATITGIMSGLTGTAGGFTLIPLLIVANQNKWVNMTTTEVVGHAQAVNAVNTTFFTIGAALLNSSNNFHMGIMAPLVFSYLLGCPVGVAVSAKLVKRGRNSIVTIYIALILGVVGAGMFLKAFLGDA